jgi:hypothetical protein
VNGVCVCRNTLIYNVVILKCLTIKIKNLSWRQYWSILTLDVSTVQEFYMKEISSTIFRNMARFFIFMVRLYLLIWTAIIRLTTLSSAIFLIAILNATHTSHCRGVSARSQENSSSFIHRTPTLDKR